MRTFGLDDVVPHYGVSSRAIVKALQHAVHELGVPHPLHVHCNNLGLRATPTGARHHRGGRRPAAASRAPAVLRLRQGGPRGFSSAAERLAEELNAAKTVTIDVGQVMFGQTVTVSSDVLRQFGARHGGGPK